MAVLLQRRGADGIWGGLMCLPEFESKAALVRRARALGAGPVPLTSLPPRRHALTHLTLAIEPYVALTPAPARAGDAERWRWVSFGDLDRAALPAPHRALLRELRDRIGR